MHRAFVLALLLGACQAQLSASADSPGDASADFVLDSGAPSVDAGLAAWSTPQRVTGLLTVDVDDPTLTSDLLELYFNANGDIYVAKRASATAAWPTPTLVTELNTPSGETTPDVFGDGLTIYFASNRAGGLGDYDIWRATRAARSDPWNAPVHVPELSSPAGDASASMTADQLMIVTTSNRQDGMTYDLYVSTRATTTAPWDAPVALATLNVAGRDETSGFLSPDGLTIFYDTGAVEHDLYFSVRANRMQPFPTATRIAEVSSPQADYDPWVSPDQRRMFLSSERNGVEAIYEAER